MNLFKIGFLTVTLVDVVDLFIVSWIFYTVYQYFKGTRAGQMLVQPLGWLTGFKRSGL